ncbi:MAG: DNA-binding transcriptional regulator OxyR [Gammaproteobacteria bacterium]|nr:DNA-binding transcriptional regulator OxyR [Gammaproteobacteria bacterium]
MIKIRELEYLDAIERHKHFGKAAEACHVSQPTLSGQIIKLEEQLGVTLIERHRRNIMLTPAGNQLLVKARKVLNAAHDLEVTAKTLGDPLSGEMHIGLIPTLAPYLLPHIMSQLIGKLSRMEFFLHENQTADLIRSLDQGLLDALILPWLDEMKDFDAYDLFDEPFLLAVNKGHELAKKKRVKLDDLKGCHVLTLEDGHCLRDQALGYCFSAGADEDKRFQATSLETLRYMVASGIGITLLPKLSVIDQPDNSELTYIPFQQPMPSRRIVLLIRQNYTRGETVREIVAAIRAAMKIKLKG